MTTKQEREYLDRVASLGCRVCANLGYGHVDCEKQLASRMHMMYQCAMDQEVWIPVVGWEGYYEVSSCGRVRSMIRKGVTNLGEREYGGRLVKPIRVKTGYLVVNLTIQGKRKQCLVHLLVLRSFRGTPPIGMQACHNNGNRTDPRLTNLRWDTVKNNHADKHLHGTAQVGERSTNVKLTELQARTAKYAAIPIATLANDFGVSTTTIRNIQLGKTWRHV